MARYFAVHLDAHNGWKKIPETLGKIKVAVTAHGHVVWQDAKQVDVWTGHRWETVWKPTAVVHPPTSHTKTVTARVSGHAVSWTRPHGTITRQVVTLHARGSGAHGNCCGHNYSIKANGTQSFTVSTSAHSGTLNQSSGAISRITVRITYHA